MEEEIFGPVLLLMEDILEKLIPYAAKSEIFILGATGEVSYLELVHPQEAPVANNVLQVCIHFHLYIILIRVPYPFQWGAPTFDASEAFAMMMASFVALVEDP
ncbi:Nucleobase-ascorbate transporter 6 [Glycine max]|nr:Nucleobase-ascorbate transporter 6 [Glycine max]